MAAVAWQLRARVLRRHFHPAPSIRPPCAPAEAPVIGSEVGHGAPAAESISGSMELMAVPKSKISKYKKKLRNNPKNLKPIPVIAQCSICGRYRLPMYFCCSPWFRAKKDFKV
ncbi:uncharacterized protein LOC112342925 [Selaginella moellendorffii]|uniref:uncharacterized protein LOC112342925 n=1 Tax=Selaginella moellendorffii TaxID=88036 RepID=UPI000D1D0BA8|nr:uncharacterized protein LOC112342925 [Selaginella moellendorffii]|eukprot:XP_024521325.1 uncharacterized protein LOC112342925 [Selaginella moellendorffii]